jgi:hypothetical protein
MKAIDIIEPAKSYYLLSKEHVVTGSKPFLAGNRINLELILEGIEDDMIIATSGNDKRCIVLVDYTDEEAWHLIRKGDNKLLKIKASN